MRSTLAVILMCLILMCLILCPPAIAASPVIIDTDAGSDDLLAIAFLLAREDVKIEAITVANGLAHVRNGGEIVLRLLDLAGQRDVPVYLGRDQPLRGTNEFPKEWRDKSDRIPGVRLPALSRKPEAEPAAAFLARRFANGQPKARILALGPLTNLAPAFTLGKPAPHNVEEIVIMGGAMRVPGNLGDGGYFKTENRTAEWNLFVDPLAAAQVFASRARLRVVPLDATNRVPVDADFLREMNANAKTALGRFVVEVLEPERKYIEEKIYFAWDPLAAAALVDPGVVKTTRMAIAVQTQGSNEGQTATL
ncbi:MAG: nucleoside hydrolase, partial [Bryobacteraceae bacterium]